MIHMTTMKTSPNDARHVVWAISVFFFLSFVFYIYQLILFIVFKFYLQCEGIGMPMMAKMGPHLRGS